MVDLITTAEARYQLRLDEPGSDGGPDAGWLAAFIPAVSDAIATWLKDEWRLFVPETDSAGNVLFDSSGDPIPTAEIRPAVKAAALVELASQFRFREGEGDNAVPSADGHGYVLSKGATALLSGLRRSTVR